MATQWLHLPVRCQAGGGARRRSAARTRDSGAVVAQQDNGFLSRLQRDARAAAVSRAAAPYLRRFRYSHEASNSPRRTRIASGRATAVSSAVRLRAPLYRGGSGAPIVTAAIHVATCLDTDSSCSARVGGIRVISGLPRVLDGTAVGDDHALETEFAPKNAVLCGIIQARRHSIHGIVLNARTAPTKQGGGDNANQERNISQLQVLPHKRVLGA